MLTDVQKHYVRDLVHDCIVNCEMIDTEDIVVCFKILLPRLMGQHSSLPGEVVVKITNLVNI